MKNLWAASVLIALAGCETSPFDDGTVSRNEVQSCWREAGLLGDFYKFYDPVQHGKLTTSGASNPRQVDNFNRCISKAT